MTREEELISHIKEYLDNGMWKYEACYLCKEDLQIIIKALEQQEPKTGWIPVSEKLPTVETDVLLTSWDGKQAYVGRIDACGKWKSDDWELLKGYEPIAWMPYQSYTGGVI